MPKGSEAHKSSKKKARLTLKEKRMKKKGKRAGYGGHEHSEDIVS